MVMALGAFSAMAGQSAAKGSIEPAIADVVKMDIGPEIRARQPNTAEALAAASALPAWSGPAGVYVVGDKVPYYVGSDGTSDFMEFEKRGEGSLVEIWVATDLSYPAGDPRNNDLSKILIEDWMVEFMINEFETIIYPIESDYFGLPDPLDGSNSIYAGTETPYFEDTDGKLMIMIFNIVDDSFDDPTYPSYVVGYFSPGIKVNYDRNVIHLDNWDWKDRIGADVARPFVYESTVAHEYQHLLHDCLDADEKLFINEGCSMYSEMLCGYGVPWDFIQRFLYTPDNSLTEWGDQGNINILADYGVAAMFTVYLSDHFGGGSFVSALAANEANGEEGVTDALADAGFTDWDFEKVFHVWQLANLIHSDEIGDGWYNYDSFDLNDKRAGRITTLKINPGMGYVTQSYAFQYTWTYDKDNTGTYLLGPYGTDYLKIGGVRAGQMAKLSFKFDGNDMYEPGWKLTTAPAVPGFSGMVWYSGASDERDVSITRTVDLTLETEATLTFDTYYSIEEQWDFGFVQVSTDGGVTWTSLANEYTRSDIVVGGYPAIKDNLPGFTGTGYGNMAFDMTAYCGSSVMLAFRYMTDWGYTDPGWYVDNIAINGVIIENGDDVKTFVSSKPPVEVDFSITIYAPETITDEVSLPYKMETLSLDDAAETITLNLAGFAGYQDVYIIVSPDTGPTNYRFGLLRA